MCIKFRLTTSTLVKETGVKDDKRHHLCDIVLLLIKDNKKKYFNFETDAVNCWFSFTIDSFVL